MSSRPHPGRRFDARPGPRPPDRPGLRPADGPAPDGAPIITQALIAELAAARAVRRPLDVREDLLRRRILDLDAAGAAVEPGGLTLRVASYERPRLTAANLAAALGPGEARLLLRRMPVARFQTVRIGHHRPGDEDDFDFL